MNIDLDIQYIERGHRVGRPNSAVRFTSQRARQKFMKSKKVVFEHNKKYKTSYYVFEDITRNRSEIAQDAKHFKKSQHIKDTWTSDGKILMIKLACVRKCMTCQKFHQQQPTERHTRVQPGNQWNIQFNWLCTDQL